MSMAIFHSQLLSSPSHGHPYQPQPPIGQRGAVCSRHGAHKGEAEGFGVVGIQAVALENHGEIHGENHEIWGKTYGKPMENHGKPMEIMENHGKPMEIKG